MYPHRPTPFPAALIVWLPGFLLCAADAPTSPKNGPDKGKAEVQLPEVRTTDWRMQSYFSVEGEKSSSSSLRIDRPESDRIDIAPGLKGERSAGTNAKWTWDLNTHFTPDATQTDLVRSRDQSRVAYRFDDGLFWTGFEHDLRMDYGLDGAEWERRDRSTDRLGTGQRFQYVDWGLSLNRLETEATKEDEASRQTREQWDESLWLKLKATSLFRPTVTVLRRDVNRSEAVDDLGRADADGEALTLSADGAWNRTLSWRGTWQREFITDQDWAPSTASAVRDGERSTVSTGLAWRPSARAPSLDLSFTQESGNETEQQYREKSQWSLGAAQQLTASWQAQARAGVVDEDLLNGQELRRLTAGFSSTFRLSARAQLSGEYRYQQDEKDATTTDTQLRLQLKMKW